MSYLLLFLGLACMAAGMFAVGFAVPIRETSLGSALLVVGSIAVTGGLVTIGLAAAVSELRQVIAALKARTPVAPRPLRPMDRKEGGEKRPGPPRMSLPPRPAAETPDHPGPPRPQPPVPSPSDLPPPARPAPSPIEPAPAMRNPGPDWLRRAIAEIEAAPTSADSSAGTGLFRDDMRPLGTSPRLGPSPKAEPPREEMPAAPRSLFDMAWDRPRHSEERRAEHRAEPAAPPPRFAETRAPPFGPLVSQPPQHVAAKPDPEPRPVVLKSGVIDEMAYTLFADGSIEASMPDGTMRFGSIEELRQHLEKHAS